MNVRLEQKLAALFLLSETFAVSSCYSGWLDRQKMPMFLDESLGIFVDSLCIIFLIEDEG